MQVIKTKSRAARIMKIHKLITSVGNRIGSVHFRKRSDGSLRKMCYRLHVQNPSYAMKPNGKRMQKKVSKDADNLQMTVLDVNKIRRDKKGKISGRGDWRTIPLEKVERIKVQGEIYKIPRHLIG